MRDHGVAVVAGIMVMTPPIATITLRKYEFSTFVAFCQLRFADAIRLDIKAWELCGLSRRCCSKVGLGGDCLQTTGLPTLTKTYGWRNSATGF